MPLVAIDESDLYALIRAAGYLAEGTLLSLNDAEAASDLADSQRIHADGTRDALRSVRSTLAESDPTVATDGLWVKIGLA
jgi:hypothetical protein